MTNHTKEQAYAEVLKQINLCTVENATHAAAVIIVDEKNDTVKIYGLNMDESEMPLLLLESAANISEAFKKLLKNRTLQ